MTWIRKDDQMPIHRKVAPLSDAAYRLHDEAMCWASRNLTDGRIGTDELASISKRGRLKLAAELVTRGLWHTANTTCPSPKCPTPGPDGWVIHDYLEYNPSKEKVQKERAAKAARQARWRTKTTDVDGDVDASHPASRDASSDGQQDDAPSRPVPSRPHSGSTRGESSPSARANPEPPLKCPRHEHDPDPPPCGACADARRAHERWEANQPTPDRLTGSPDWDALQRRAVTGPRRAQLAAEARAAIRRKDPR